MSESLTASIVRIVDAAIARLSIPAFRWGVIYSVSPLRVQFLGEPPADATPSALFAPTVGQTVLTVRWGSSTAVLGATATIVANSPGTISLLAGGPVPAGKLQCNGQAVSRTTYAALFAQIGTIHGVGNGTTTFNVPLIPGGVVPVSLDAAQTEFNAIGKTGGKKAVSLTAAQNGPHTHGPGVGSTFINDYVSVSGIASGSGKNASDAGATSTATASSGTGAAHNNLQPYVVSGPYWVIQC